MLKDPINVISDDLTSTIGNPKDFKEIKSKYESVIAKYTPHTIPLSACAELGRSFPIFENPSVPE
jgi:hypothetical protein